MNQRIIIGCAVGLCAAVLLAACGGTAQGQSPNLGGGGSAGAGRSARPPTTPPASGNPSPAQCSDGARLTVDPARPPAPICLGAGHVLRLSTTKSPHQPWENLTSSDPGVVTCASTRIADGAVQATCTGRKSGTAVITTQTMPFQGDPHGPAQQMWQLTITVTA